MALTNVIGLAFAPALEEELQKALVFGSPRAVTRRYEGVIRGQGDAVRIAMVSRPTVVDYTRNTDLTSPETLNDTSTTLVVDQAKAIHFAIDDIDAAQSPYAILETAARSAAYSLADVADQHVAERMEAGVQTANRIGSQSAPISIDASATNASYSTLVGLMRRLDAANVPRVGRWAIVSPQFLERLLLHQYCVFTAAPQSQAALTNGFVATVAGLDVVVSNNVRVSSNVHRIMAGVADATAFAASVQSSEQYRPERRFGNALKSLYVYGCKVIRPEMLAMAFVTFA